MLRACNALLGSIERVFPVIGVLIELLRAELSLQLKRLVSSNVVPSMMEVRDCQSFDVVFPYLGGCGQRY